MDGNGLVTIEEIREYYENHLNKLSNEGIDFIDRNFHNEKSVDIDSKFYSKMWIFWQAFRIKIFSLYNFQMHPHIEVYQFLEFLFKLRCTKI